MLEKARDSLPLVTFSNYQEIEGLDGKLVKIPKTLQDIYRDFLKAKLKFIKISGQLYHLKQAGELDPIKFYVQIERMIAAQGVSIDFSRRSNMLEKALIHEHIKEMSPSYEGVSPTPVFPPCKEFYEQHTMTLGPPTGALDRLVDFFCPASEVYKHLIKAAFITPAWSNGAGKKPLFIVAGAEGLDETVSIGKSTLAAAVGYLYKSMADVDFSLRCERFETAIIDNALKRVIRLDNVKAYGVNSTILERILTSKEISGHKMYKGHVAYKNHPTFFLTANTPVINVDLATRSQVIRLAAPKSYWDSSLIYNFIDDNRQDIFSDIQHIIMSHPTSDVTQTRFPEWERAILSKFAPAMSDIITRDREEIQAPQSEVDDFKAYIFEMLSSYPDVCVLGDGFQAVAESCVFVANGVLHTWYERFKKQPFHRRDGNLGKIFAKVSDSRELKKVKGNVIRGHWFNTHLEQKHRPNICLLTDHSNKTSNFYALMR
jgi:hypothetical protein